MPPYAFRQGSVFFFREGSAYIFRKGSLILVFFYPLSPSLISIFIEVIELSFKCDLFFLGGFIPSADLS
jgi:hypothetical protein